jgi:uncharacterized membrane protein
MKSNMQEQTRNQIIFGGFALLLVIVAVLAFVTYFAPIPQEKGFLYFAIKNHVLIMAISMIASIIFGYYWSMTLIKEAHKSHKQEEKQRKKATELSKLFWKFLDQDETIVLKYALEHDKTTQADVAKLEGMHKVKAYRTVQKLKEKNLIHVTEHGKMRFIEVDDDVEALQ